jgi:hypothetical protein
LAGDLVSLGIDSGSASVALQRFAEAEWMYEAALAFDPKSVAAQQYYEEHLKRWKTSDTSSSPIFPEISEPNS